MRLARLPGRVQTSIEALVQMCAQDHVAPVSVVLFGSAANGGFAASPANRTGLHERAHRVTVRP
jgi:hypothetical protein